MDNLQKAMKMAEIKLIQKALAKRNQKLEPDKTPQENPSAELEPAKDEIKFHNEAHRKNYEGAMKARSERKLPIDPEKMIEQIRKNSKG